MAKKLLWSILHICLVTGGTLKCNLTFKTYYWAYKLVLSQPLCHTCSNTHRFTPGQCQTTLQSTILPHSAEFFNWGYCALPSVIVVTPPYPQEECKDFFFIWKSQKEKQEHVIKLNRNCNHKNKGTMEKPEGTKAVANSKSWKNIQTNQNGAGNEDNVEGEEILPKRWKCKILKGCTVLLIVTRGQCVRTKQGGCIWGLLW